MDQHQKLKIKIGDHEFEAEGPSDVVQAQFDAFTKLLASLPPPQAAHPQIDRQQSDRTDTIPAQPVQAAATDAALGKIMKIDNRVDCTALGVL